MLVWLVGFFFSFASFLLFFQELRSLRVSSPVFLLNQQENKTNLGAPYGTACSAAQAPCCRAAALLIARETARLLPLRRGAGRSPTERTAREQGNYMLGFADRMKLLAVPGCPPERKV